MSHPKEWVYTLAYSRDLKPIGQLGDAWNKLIEPVYNRPWTFSCSLAIDDDLALQVRKRSTCVIAERDDRAIWSGPVVSVVDNVPEDRTQITCQGWLEELDHRYLRSADEASAIYTGIVGGQIAMNLLDLVNAHTDSDSIVRPTHLRSGVVSDTQVRTKRYVRGQNVGAAIRDLSNIENGYDISVDPLTRMVSTRAPTAYAAADAHFGYVIDPANLTAASRTEDGVAMANRINVVGSNGLIGFADDSAAIDDADIMLEDWITLSDVSDSGILGAYANAELIWRRNGVTTYTFKPGSLASAHDDPVNIPRLFDDFELGDQIQASVSRGRFQVSNQGIRVFSARINTDGKQEIYEEFGVTPAT